ncbi:O-methyltransferase domain [Dillenia turbinata]|uniref:O-methyltransferase domain n=1 Tax=Dillenia turbinata TaxID=194707 RepID=A0AAN8ZG47_9MAGN
MCRKEQQRNTKMEHSEKKDAQEMLQAQSHIYKHVFNFIDSMTINCAVQLGIPDIILSHNQPMTLHELVTALGIPPPKATCLQRLMRLLVHSGFFVIRKLPGRIQEVGYDLTPSSRLLLKDNVNCLTAFLLASLQPVFLTPWQSLGEWFKGKETTTFETAYGKKFWEYAEQNPDFSDMFNEAMVSESCLMRLVVKECKSVFEGMGSLVDVGGGKGIVTRVISDAFPALRCTVFDLPHVVADLPETKNLKYAGGDMFQSVPSADALLLKHVLHNWSDEECVKILKKCRQAIEMNDDKGKVLIIDMVIDIDQDEHEVTDTKLYFDMLMMVLVNGQERTVKEWEKLFFQAGFSRYKIKPIFGLRSLIEVYP